MILLLFDEACKQPVWVSSLITTVLLHTHTRSTGKQLVQVQYTGNIQKDGWFSSRQCADFLYSDSLYIVFHWTSSQHSPRTPVIVVQCFTSPPTQYRLYGKAVNILKPTVVTSWIKVDFMSETHCPHDPNYMKEQYQRKCQTDGPTEWLTDWQVGQLQSTRWISEISRG